MSKEKIEIARRGIDAFNRGDVEALTGAGLEWREGYACPHDARERHE